MEAWLCKAQVRSDKYIEIAMLLLVGDAKIWAESRKTQIFEMDWCDLVYHLIWEFDGSRYVAEGIESKEEPEVSIIHNASSVCNGTVQLNDCDFTIVDQNQDTQLSPVQFRNEVVDKQNHIPSIVDMVDIVKYLDMPDATDPFIIAPNMIKSNRIYLDNVCAALNCCSFQYEEGNGGEAPSREISKDCVQFLCITSHPSKTHLIFQYEWKPGIPSLNDTSSFLYMNIRRASAINRLCDHAYSFSNYCIIDLSEYSLSGTLSVGIFDPGINPSSGQNILVPTTGAMNASTRHGLVSNDIANELENYGILYVVSKRNITD